MEDSFGLFTPYTLRFHSEHYREDSVNLLKRSFVLFDKFAYIEPGFRGENFIEKFLANIGEGNNSNLLNLFSPITDYVPTDFLSRISFTVMPDTNMWYGPYSKDFAKFMRGYVSNRFGFDAFEGSLTHEQFEILDYYVTAMSADFNFLLQISRYDERFSALFTSLHSDAYAATYGHTTKLSERILQKICSVSHFDFVNLSWEQLFRLKESCFLQDFRTKINEWIAELHGISDQELIEKKIDQYLRDSQFDFLSANRPKRFLNLVTGVFGNIPLSIPLNPVSVISSVKQLVTDRKMKNEFGWLLFVNESRRFEQEIGYKPK